ncbi:MAG TPA: penicillin acylase family protein [Candidatus Baltobacteraceae bacterium]|nr:penicillin acylase family protein [Candidatus Baltobacteraceae bacterium]
MHAKDSGAIALPGLQHSVQIIRDRRGIPHIRASSESDLFFAQGFAEASDRFFQMDLSRRYADGTLAEMFGAKALPIDEQQRAAGLRAIAQRQWREADKQTRAALVAFSNGVNEAIAHQPLPVEYRMLLYTPQRWTPQDSIAVSLVAALELGDDYHDVMTRDRRLHLLGSRCYDAEYPLSDPYYDVTIDGERSTAKPHAALPDCPRYLFASARERVQANRPHLGSNAWAAGAQRTRDHHALIANDPHVDLTIPGIWYLVDLQAPRFHAAGAVVPGLPGITLGHNAHLAWAVTNAQVATNVLYRARLPRTARIEERFNIRFGAPVFKTYYRTNDAFQVPDDSDASQSVVVRWPVASQRVSSIASSLALDRADTLEQAAHALTRYGGSPENVLLADERGRIAYRLAGTIPDDPSWGRYIHPASDLQKPMRTIAYASLPQRLPAASGVLVSANNRMYGDGYRYRLSAAFEPPYRAWRIASLLRDRREFTAAGFATMQLDAYSPLDAEFAHAVARIARYDSQLRGSVRERSLAGWNGVFSPDSRAAALEHEVRGYLQQSGRSLPFLLADLRAAPHDLDEDVNAALWPAQQSAKPWGEIGRVDVEHPLSPMWYGMLRGASFPGDGDEFTIHLQEPGFAQGFRAVWEAGNWDAGGIVIPSGESGEPGSAHYDDLASQWVRGGIVPLPFSRAAVDRQAQATLILNHL